MDPAPLALTAVRLVAPYVRRVLARTVGQAAEEIADGAAGRIKALMGILGDKIRGTPDLERLNALARRPDDRQVQDDVTGLIKELIAEDPSFGAELARGVKAAQIEIHRSTNVARDQGLAQSGQGNVQVRADNVYMGAQPSQSVPLSRVVLEEMRSKEQELHHYLRATLQWPAS